MEIEYRYERLPELGKLPLRQHIVVLSGAGMSAESGLSTFRDKDGLWKQYDWKRPGGSGGNCAFNHGVETGAVATGVKNTYVHEMLIGE